MIGDVNLKAAALGAAGLWRFRPAVLDGCPASAALVIGIRFAMERR